MRPLLRALRWFRRGLRQAAERPLVLVGLLLLELLPAMVLVMPARAALSAALDSSLWSETLRHGPDGEGLVGLVRGSTLAGGSAALASVARGEFPVSGSLATGSLGAVVAAGVALYWLHGMASCGFLATLYSERPREQRQFAAATAYYALPATGLSLLAGAGYLTTIWLLYDRGGALVALALGEPSTETLALALTWGRLALTAIGLLGIKLLLDLSRLEMVERGTRNWPWVALLSLTRFLRHGPRFLPLYLVHGAALLALATVWWLVPGRFWPQGWLGLGLLFAAQQLFALTRLGLRLARLAAMRSQLQDLTQRGKWAAYKIEPPGAD